MVCQHHQKQWFRTWVQFFYHTSTFDPEPWMVQFANSARVLRQYCWRWFTLQRCETLWSFLVYWTRSMWYGYENLRGGFTSVRDTHIHVKNITLVLSINAKQIDCWHAFKMEPQNCLNYCFSRYPPPPHIAFQDISPSPPQSLQPNCQ